MSIHRYNASTDGNQKDIIDALQSVGCRVYYIKQPVDLLVGFRGKNYLLEVKQSKAKTTPAQDRFFESWTGQHKIVRTPEEALKAVGATS